MDELFDDMLSKRLISFEKEDEKFLNLVIQNPSKITIELAMSQLYLLKIEDTLAIKKFGVN